MADESEHPLLSHHPLYHHDHNHEEDPYHPQDPEVGGGVNNHRSTNHNRHRNPSSSNNNNSGGGDSGSFVESIRAKMRSLSGHHDDSSNPSPSKPRASSVMLKQRTSSIDTRGDYTSQTWTSVIGILQPMEAFITVDHFSLWRRHLAWAMEDGKDLRGYMTQRYASSMVFMSLLLASELNLLFNSSNVCTDMRKQLHDENYYDMKFYIGLCIIISVILTLFSLLSTFTAWAMVNAISEANTHCIFRSSIGQFVTELPGMFIVCSIYAFIVWVVMFTFVLLPLNTISICLLLVIITIYIMVITAFSAFGRIIMHTGAMGSDRIFDPNYERMLLPHGLHTQLLTKAKSNLANNTSITRQYRKKNYKPISGPLGQQDDLLSQLGSDISSYHSSGISVVSDISNDPSQRDQPPNMGTGSNHSSGSSTGMNNRQRHNQQYYGATHTEENITLNDTDTNKEPNRHRKTNSSHRRGDSAVRFADELFQSSHPAVAATAATTTTTTAQNAPTTTTTPAPLGGIISYDSDSTPFSLQASPLIRENKAKAKQQQKKGPTKSSLKKSSSSGSSGIRSRTHSGEQPGSGNRPRTHSGEQPGSGNRPRTHSEEQPGNRGRRNSNDDDTEDSLQRQPASVNPLSDQQPTIIVRKNSLEDHSSQQQQQQQQKPQPRQSPPLPPKKPPSFRTLYKTVNDIEQSSLSRYVYKDDDTTATEEDGNEDSRTNRNTATNEEEQDQDDDNDPILHTMGTYSTFNNVNLTDDSMQMWLQQLNPPNSTDVSPLPSPLMTQRQILEQQHQLQQQREQQQQLAIQQFASQLGHPSPPPPPPDKKKSATTTTTSRTTSSTASPKPPLFYKK